MNLKKWMKDIKLKFKKDRKLISENKKEHLFQEWIIEENKLRYQIGSKREDNGCVEILRFVNLDVESIVNETWGLDRIAKYYCDEWNKSSPFSKDYDLCYTSNHQWINDSDNNYIFMKNTDIKIFIKPSDSWDYSPYYNLKIEIYSKKLNILISDRVDESHTKYVFKALGKLLNCYTYKKGCRK